MSVTCISPTSYLASPSFLKISVHIVTGFSLPIHLLGLYIITCKTPKYMSSVKWYFARLHFWILVYDNTLGLLVTPLLLLPSVGGVCYGVFEWIGVPHLLMTVLALWACTNMLLSILAIFENQFHIIGEFSWMPYWEKCRRFWIGTHYFIAVVMFIPFHYYEPNQEEAKARVFQNLPCLPDFLRDENLYVLTETPTYHLIALVGLLTTGCLEQVAFLVLLFLNAIQQSKSRKLSQQTYKLQRKFLLAICIQTGVPGFLMVFPLTYKWVAVAYNYYNQIFLNFTVIAETMHGLLSTIMTIMIHQPYRSALFSLSTKYWKRKYERPDSESFGNTRIVHVSRRQF